MIQSPESLYSDVSKIASSDCSSFYGAKSTFFQRLLLRLSKIEQKSMTFEEFEIVKMFLLFKNDIFLRQNANTIKIFFIKLSLNRHPLL